MSFISKEEFEAIVKQNYTNLDEDGFKDLLKCSLNKLKSLAESGDLIRDSSGNLYSLNTHYQLSLDVFRSVAEKKKISFNQYKVLCTFTKQHTHKLNTEYKQF
jgi:hypothetical protein